MTDTGSVQEDGSWKNGGLCAGTYNDGAGKILGVVYPVCISQADLDSLTDKYNFTALDTKPAAYKPVTVEGGKASFGKLVDSDGEETLGGEVKVSTRSNYGDYQISVSEIPQNADIYGVSVKTSEGTSYGMRALENIWRNGAISWGAGVKEKESFWSEPYYYQDDLNVTSGNYMTFATPIFDAQGRLACVCGADMTQEWMIDKLRQIEDEVRNDELLNNYRLPGNDDFFIVILNDDGTSFAHCDGSIVTINDEAFIANLKNQHRGVTELEVNGVPSRVYYTPLKRTHWSVAIVVEK